VPPAGELADRADVQAGAEELTQETRFLMTKESGERTVVPVGVTVIPGSLGHHGATLPPPPGS
jgi:hypothetical protein